MIKHAKIVFFGMTTRDLDEFNTGNFDFAALKRSGGIEITASITAGAIKELIRREVSCAKTGFVNNW